MTDAEVVAAIETSMGVLLRSARVSKAASAAKVASLAILITPTNVLTLSIIDQPITVLQQACKQYQPLGFVIMLDATVTTEQSPEDRPAIVFVAVARSGFERLTAYPYTRSPIGAGAWHDVVTQREVPPEYRLL